MTAAYQKKKVLHDLSFTLKKGEKLGIVGESGSGKSTLTRVLSGFHPTIKGELSIRERPVQATVKDRRWLCKLVQVVFQDPFSSLDPQQTVQQVLEEPLLNFFTLTKEERNQQLLEIVEEVNLEKDLLKQKSRTVSGGQAQRICIARALLARPDILICDEPVTSLDMMTQIKILNLLKKIVTEKQLSIVFVSHDISLVFELCDTVLVLKDGKKMDFFKAADWHRPERSSYTNKLIHSVHLK
nr:dipeptide/oligopeptide/nickel ABC transporter ATP-binding protein [Halalkalibacter oceani]